MLPSKTLRNIISKKKKIKLEYYKWSKDLEKRVFSFKFIDGKKRQSLKRIFEDGFNIGNCLLTSFYVSQVLENSILCAGKVDLLIGTKNSENGDHVWLETDEYIIDTTLMIIIPNNDMLAEQYHKESIISFSELPTDTISFQHDYYEMTHFPLEYFQNLYITK